MLTPDNLSLKPKVNPVLQPILIFLFFFPFEDDVDVNDQAHNGDTALHVLCSSERIDASKKIQIAEKLLAAGDLDVERCNNENVRPISFACKRYEVDVVKFLVEKCQTDLSKKQEYPHGNLINALLEEPDDYDYDDDGPWVPSRQEKEKMNHVFDYLSELSATKWMLQECDLYRAISCLNEHISLKLIGLAENKKKLLNEPISGCTKTIINNLGIAAENGMLKVVQALLELGADPNELENGYLPLHSAILELRMVIQLIEDNHIIEEKGIDLLEIIRILARKTRIDYDEAGHVNLKGAFSYAINSPRKILGILLEECPYEKIIFLDSESPKRVFETVLGLFLQTYRNVHDEHSLELVKKLIGKEKAVHQAWNKKTFRPLIQSLMMGCRKPNIYAVRIVNWLVQEGFDDAELSYDDKKLIWKCHPGMIMPLIFKGIIHPEILLPECLDEQNWPQYRWEFQDFISKLYFCIVTLKSKSLQNVWNEKCVKEFKVQEEVSNTFSTFPSLLHLSRLSARQVFLKESFNFKKVPSFKELPKTLQDYVLFSDLDKKQLTLSYADIKANYDD